MTEHEIAEREDGWPLCPACGNDESSRKFVLEKGAAMAEEAKVNLGFHVLTEEQARLVNERITEHDHQMYRDCQHAIKDAQHAIKDAVRELRDRQRDLIDCERDLRERYAPEIADERPE